MNSKKISGVGYIATLIYLLILVVEQTSVYLQKGNYFHATMMVAIVFNILWMGEWLIKECFKLAEKTK